MATVTNWIDHLSAKEVVGAVIRELDPLKLYWLFLVQLYGSDGMSLLTILKAKNFLDWLRKDMVLMITKTTLPTGN